MAHDPLPRDGTAAVRLHVVTEQPQASASAVARSVQGILDATNLCAIATVGESRDAHVSTAFYANTADLTALYILTPPGTTHARNVEFSPSAAAAVYSSTQVWGTQLKGVQLRGEMRAASGPHEVEAFQLYTRRFPGLQHWTRSLAELHDTLESRFYRFQIAHIKVLDEDAFGKEAWLEAAIL